MDLNIKHLTLLIAMLFTCLMNANAQELGKRKGDLLLGFSTQLPLPGINWIGIVDGGSYEKKYSPEFGTSLGYRMPVTNRIYIEPEIEYTLLFFDDKDENYGKNFNFINLSIGFPVDLTKNTINNFYLVPGVGYTTSFHQNSIGESRLSESGRNFFLKYIYSRNKSFDRGIKIKLVIVDYDNSQTGRVGQTANLVNELRISFKLF